MAEASYLALYADGELQKRIRTAIDLLKSCTVCPRQCKVNRLEDEKGVCRTGRRAVVSSYGPHFGEEGPLVGMSGSGTIFITHCNLGCIFCQNYDVSHEGDGFEVEAGQLAATMVSLQKQGCHNINFVTPTHVIPQILEALPPAIDKGLSVPLVYNSSAYDSVSTLQVLEGIFDIYMPDFKFWQPETAGKLAGAPDYPQRAQEAIREMHRQAGVLETDSRGVARKGLIVRHLVMPEGLDETREILNFLAREISVKTYVNVMDQYRPCGEAHNFPPINRMLSAEEYNQALRYAEEAGLTNLDQRDWIRALRHLKGF